MGFWSDLGSAIGNGTVDTINALPGGKLVTAPIVAIEGTYTDIKDTASAAESVAQHVLSAGEWMSDPHNWLRVLYVVAGTVVVLVGLAVAFKDTGVGRVAQQGAALAAA